MSSFWSLFRPAAAPAPAARRFTLEELRSLWAVLAANPVVTESNRQLVVESLRSVAEFIIWGDQHEGRIFDFFLEHNVMTYLHSVLLQPSNRRGEVAKQVLQTLSIIIQNVRSETASFFLFSNNHINNIVDLDFDWDDEEVLGYYVSFLKTISLRLNAGTVQFFIQTAPPAPAPAFPLYTRALALAHNREGMVRAAVRTLTLHVYSVDDPAIAAFVTSPPAASYFGDVAAYLAKHVALLDKRLAAAEGGGSMALGSLDSQLAEVEDVLSYVSDLLSLGVPSIAQLLASSIWQCVVWPQLLRPLLEPAAAAQAAAAAAAAAAGRPSRGNSSSSSRGLAGSPGSSFRQPGSNAGSPGYGRQLGDAGGGGSRQQAATCVRPVCAVFVLERLFQLLMYAPLLQQLLLALMCSSSSNSGGSGTSGGGCRAGLLAMLTGGDPYAAVMVLRLLVAALNNRHISAELLAALAVLPRKRQQQGAAQQQQQLGELAALVEGLVAQLQALREGDVDAAAQQQGQGGGRDASSALGGGQASSSMAGAAAAGGTRSSSGELLHLLTQQYLPAQLQALAQQCSHTQQGREGAGTAAGAAAAGAAGDAGTGAAGAAGAARLCRGKHSHSSSLGELEDLLVMQPQQDSGPAAAAAAGAAGAGAAFNSVGPQLLAALLQLLQAEGLPAMGLWLAGWLLHQLLPAAEAAAGGGAVVAPQRPTTPPDGAAEAASSRRHSRASSSSCSSSSSELSGEDDGSIVDTCGYTSRASSSVSTAAASMDGAALPPYLHAEQGASLLSPQQQLLLQAAVNAARAEFARQLSGMWCEAVFPMLSSEWPRAREMMQRPVLRAGSEAVLSGTAVWPLLVGVQQQQQQQAPQQQQQQQGLAVAARGTAMDALSASARAGLSCYFAVQRVVAMTQLQELLSCGAISHEPPAPTVSDAELKQMDVQEGYQVDLAPGSALPCVVSFAPGQERRVLFAVAGLSCQQLAGAQHDASAAAQQPAGRAALLSSLPVAVLADPSPSRPNAGVVLSVAPLLGARPYCDQGVPKWLHVHVRPSVRGLQRVVRTAAANKGGLLSAMRQLADGHWVLAFSSADKAAAAVSLAQQHTERLQRLYRDALAVLCPLMPPAAAQQEQVLEQPPQCREQQLQQQPPDHRQQDLEHVSEPQECLQEQQQVVGADACPAGASHEAAAEQPTDLAAAADKAAATGQALGAAVALAAEAGG